MCTYKQLLVQKLGEKLGKIVLHSKVNLHEASVGKAVFFWYFKNQPIVLGQCYWSNTSGEFFIFNKMHCINSTFLPDRETGIPARPGFPVEP